MNQDKKRMKTCYACGAPATSREHFPPKSFFPNKGRSLQLKTVPSCHDHNGSKSHDDLYVLTHICLNTSRNGSNLPAKRFIESVVPSLQQSPKFRAMLLRGSEDLEAGARVYRVDTKRCDDFFDLLVRAIYFDRYGDRLDETRHNVRHSYLNFLGEEGVEFAASMIKDFKENNSNLVDSIEADKIDEVVYKFDVIDPVKNFASITINHSFYEFFNVVSWLTFQWDGNG